MWRWLLFFGLGCSYSPPRSSEPTDASDPTDAAGSVDRCWSIAELQLTLCPATMPAGTLRPTSSVQIDTASDTCAVLKPPSSDVCVVAANAIIVDAGIVVSATGARPLVLLAVASIEIRGSIDVASHFGGQSGPASDLPGCDAGTAPTNSGGGQGGSFGGMGGNGGNASGGIAGAVVVIDNLRGGCPGAIGDGSNRPDGRRGGGAVALVAETITLGPSSTIDASGAAGDGADTSANGGSGGGSGGMIVFQGTTIVGDPSPPAPLPSPPADRVVEAQATAVTVDLGIRHPRETARATTPAVAVVAAPA